MRAGVPVFIRSLLKPSCTNCSVSPCEAGSDMRPPGICVLPQCINPFKKVPLVNTTACASTSIPSPVFTPHTLLFIIIVHVLYMQSQNSPAAQILKVGIDGLKRDGDTHIWNWYVISVRTYQCGKYCPMVKVTQQEVSSEDKSK